MLPTKLLRSCVYYLGVAPFKDKIIILSETGGIEEGDPGKLSELELLIGASGSPLKAFG